MKIMQKKSKIAIALFLMLSFAVSMFAVLPNAEGQVIKVPDRDTGAYISTNPDLIGINQELTVNLWVYPSPTGPHFEMGSQVVEHGGVQGIHFDNLTVTFTRPDGSKDTFMPLDGSAHGLGLVPGQSEEIGAIWFLYKPTALGTWSVSFSYPGQTYIFLNYSVFYKPSTSRTITFEVQEESVQVGLAPVQLPTGYWERPIHSDNREWSQISGDWLSMDIYGHLGTNFNPFSTAPNAPHILWKRETSLGGLIGGEWGGISYDGAGGTPSLILDGKVYYNLVTASGTMMTCVDLRTDELIWQRLGSISQGRIAAPAGIYEFGSSPVPYLWEYSATTGWKRYDAWSGNLMNSITTGITNLGTPFWLDDNICYVLRQGAWSGVTFRRPFNELIKWNMSKVTGNDWKTGIVWNVSLKQPDGTGPGEGSRGSTLRLLPDLGIVDVHTLGEGFHYAFDINTGAKLWIRDIGWPAQRYYWGPEDTVVASKEADMTLHAFKVSASGVTELWSVQVGEYPWGENYVAKGFAYGNWYIGTYDGHVYCLDWASHTIKWSFYVGDTTETPFGTWAQGVYYCAIADGKLYFGTSEHSPTQPRPRGNKLFCIDAITGKGIWNITSVPNWNGAMGLADGYLVTHSEADGLMYCFGKGQTETSVSVSDGVINEGSSVLVKGSVLDMSPAQAGTAAISDEDMTVWMEYLHQMNATLVNNPPMTAKGVEVSLDAVDPNNNFVHIGTVTSDSAGTYGLAFAPEVPGLYKIIATFAGSESYWASYAETYVNVEAAHAVSPPAEQVPTDFTPIYTALAGGVIAIIVAIAIAVVLILRKR